MEIRLMSTAKSPIPEDEALKICHEIQEQNRLHRLSAAKVQCWGCQKASKSDARKMCFYSQPDNRGCQLVNKHYDLQFDKKGV